MAPELELGTYGGVTRTEVFQMIRVYRYLFLEFQAYNLTLLVPFRLVPLNHAAFPIDRREGKYAVLAAAL
jgi:hypothetical protein